MSWHDCPQAACRFTAAEIDPIEMVIVPRTRDLGGFEVRRALPSREKRMVGPFIFFDQMGPSEFHLREGLDVRPHPHIGLATVTYLFQGEIMHRDSLGTALPIKPGEVNWMTAGHGIAHSERTPDAQRETGGTLFGIQAWVALPGDVEETAPDFTHHADDTLPVIEDHGIRARVIAGSMFGGTSPIPTFSETACADVALEAGASVPFDAGHEERAVYVAGGEIEIGERAHGAGELLILRPGDSVGVKALSDSRILLFGGEPMDGPRHIWWNFVSSRKERIEQAKHDWKAGKFDAVPDDTEYTPLPDLPGP